MGATSFENVGVAAMALDDSTTEASSPTGRETHARRREVRRSERIQSSAGQFTEIRNLGIEDLGDLRMLATNPRKSSSSQILISSHPQILKSAKSSTPQILNSLYAEFRISLPIDLPSELEAAGLDDRGRLAIERTGAAD